VRRESVLAQGVLALALLPSLVWIWLDREVWTWDPAWYGYHTLKLHYALWETPAQWPKAMLKIQEVKAPGIAWIGQFFVPLGWLLGSSDLALMIFVVFTQLLALVLLYRSLAELSRGNVLVALCAALSLAAGPLFVALSHEYYTEALQTLVVIWFVLIMSFAPRWRRSLILSQLLAATALAMLAKASSPLYCCGPGLVALVYAFRPKATGHQSSWRQHRGTILTLAAGVPLLLGAVGWYGRNLGHIASFVAYSASSPLYGARDTIWHKLQYWAAACRYDFFYLPLTALLTIVIVTTACVLVVTQSRGRSHFHLCAAVSALEIIVVLLVLSISVNEATRYLLPLFVFFRY
jgi:hypothetical protein